MICCHRAREALQARFIQISGDRAASRTAPNRQQLILRHIAPLLLICMGLSGCGRSSDVMEPDHAAPKHKPATFSEAIDEIARRHEQLVQSVNDSKSSIGEQMLTELLDIIGWLPELAADSSMKKPEWDLANATSKELLSLYQSATRGMNVNSSQLRIDGKRVTQLCNQLKSLSDSIER